MTKQELIVILEKCAEDSDIETAHIIADESLIDFIADAEVSKAFDAITKWYA